LVDRPHIHGQCQKCGAIIDVDSALLAPVAEELLRVHGFVLDPDHGALLGTCAACAAARL
ncbi:MAG: Fur family transcriptional regulator, ferric uptake regulator, partial [Frankiaceae bacterium]|nr:Fur family transcriptional regulator, ferric uptake regulator [Frankiaceae bacterium]